MAEDSEVDGDSKSKNDTSGLVMQVPEKMDPELTIRYAQAIELFSEQTRKCFACGSEEHLVQDCPSRAAKVVKATLNENEGRSAPQLEKQMLSQPTSQWEQRPKKAAKPLPES